MGREQLPASPQGWSGGPGFIFLLLIVLIGTGVALYLGATGRLDSLLSEGIDVAFGPDLSSPAGTNPPAEEDAALQSMQPLVGSTSGDQTAKAPGPIQLIALSPAELLAQRPPPATLALKADELDAPPYRRFSRPAMFLGDRPRLAFLITGLGLNKAVTAAAIADTPPEISLSFSPYADEIGDWIAVARAFGHEVFVDLPLEPTTYPKNDPGPLGLLTALKPDENRSRLDAILDRADGSLGVATQLGDRFLSDESALAPVLAALAERGFGLVVTRSEPNAVAGALPKDGGKLPWVTAVGDLGSGESRGTLNRRIESIVNASLDTGASLAVAGPFPLNIAAIAAWAPAANPRGLALVPASALLHP